MGISIRELKLGHNIDSFERYIGWREILEDGTQIVYVNITECKECCLSGIVDGNNKLVVLPDAFSIKPVTSKEKGYVGFIKEYTFLNTGYIEVEILDYRFRSLSKQIIKSMSDLNMECIEKDLLDVIEQDIKYGVYKKSSDVTSIENTKKENEDLSIKESEDLGIKEDEDMSEYDEILNSIKEDKRTGKFRI